MRRRLFLACGLAVRAQGIDEYQLPPRSVFDKSMPRYPNAWFYLESRLAANYKAAVDRLTKDLGEAMRLPEFFPPFDNPEGCDFEARIENLEPWIDNARRALQHAHAFHLRYYYTALENARAERVTVGGKAYWRIAASVHYEVEHANPHHADVEDCPVCGRTGEYAGLAGNLVEQVHDPLGLELLMAGTIRGKVVRHEDRGRTPVGSVKDMRGVKVATQLFPGQTGDRNTYRIGVALIGGR
jgi:hypothetical protein